jgi:hypothetical protein
VPVRSTVWAFYVQVLVTAVEWSMIAGKLAKCSEADLRVTAPRKPFGQRCQRLQRALGANDVMNS